MSGIKIKCNEPLTPEEKTWFNGNPVFINVGRIDIPKGQWHLIRAFKGVTEQFPNARLLILGDGEYREYLCELTKSLRLNKNIIFCIYCHSELLLSHL